MGCLSGPALGWEGLKANTSHTPFPPSKNRPMPIQFISPTPEARPRKKVDPNSRCTVEQRRKIDLACQSLRLNQQVILHYARVRFELGVLKPLRGLQDLTYQQATRLLKEIKEGQVEC